MLPLRLFECGGERFCIRASGTGYRLVTGGCGLLCKLVQRPLTEDLLKRLPVLHLVVDLDEALGTALLPFEEQCSGCIRRARREPCGRSRLLHGVSSVANLQHILLPLPFSILPRRYSFPNERPPLLQCLSLLPLH